MYDVVIIGGGPGGYAAAIRAAQLGGKTALIEAASLGGTCVNRGCIPSKIWLRAAYLYTMTKRAGDFGIILSLSGLNLNKIVERKNGVASEIRMGMKSLLANYGIEHINGRAVIRNSKEIDVDGKKIEARIIIIATGSSPDVTGAPGIDMAVSVDQLFDLAKLPKSALILGAGSNEIEAANMLAVFGVKVHLVADGARILPLEDHDISQRMSQALRQQGVEVITRHNIMSLSKRETGYSIVLAGPKERSLDVDMVIVGKRKPNTEGLGLKNIGVVLNDDGGIKVNDSLETSVRGIYAIGDVTGGWMLSHAASSMGVTASENAMGGNKTYPSHLVSRGLWTIPQVGAVGLSEEEAEKKGYDVKTGEFPYAINGLAMGHGLTEGSVKVVSDAKDGDLLGVHIVGENATELIGEAVLAMQFECSVDELAHSIRVHPSCSETLVDAARDSDGWALYLPKT
ncbi:MAG: dihydrolipoyl dehydrogenase [Desulfobacteraceae bacterium]|nr:MAG: dihydrolipoyl dehydrogenase [Desulfobacteraceae bacterium]RPH53179.1 MAG: dihydrolipoyl dehydrogenase [Desulfobacteraceae bacterium]